MEANETLRKMREMKLAGMADAFAGQLADRLTYDALPAETRVGMLVDAELDRRQATRLENLLKGAKLRFSDACSESVIYDAKRGLARDELARLFGCAFVGDGIDVVITGPTGSGKSWMACALVVAGCRHYYSSRYVRLPELLGELAAARAAGRYERAMAKWRKYDLLALDEFVLNACTKEETRDIYELVEGRSRVRATVYCSQYREAGWLERLGGGTSAEGIVDRIANNCYRLSLTGDVNMRELTSRVAR